MNKRFLRQAMVIALLGPALLAGSQVIDEVVAVVNGEIITHSELRARFDLMAMALRAQARGEDLDAQIEALKKTLLDRMVTELLLLQKAREMKLDVREQVRLTIDNIKSQNNLESDEDLRTALQREGLDFAKWVKQMEEDLMRQGVLFNEVDRQIVIDDAEVVNAYKAKPEDYTEPEEVKLRGVFLSEGTLPDQELEAKRSEISAKLAAGEDLAVLAGSYSDGPPRDVQGDLGAFKQGELDPALEKAVQGLQPGQLSAWVKSRNGWYLLRLESRKERKLRVFEEVRKDIEERIFNQKRAKAIEEYLDKAKTLNYVKILRPDALDY